MDFRILYLVLVNIVLSNIAFSQVSTNATGGTASGNGGTVTYSIGQVLFEQANNGEFLITQGIQHAYEIYTNEKEEIKSSFSFNVYPNPTSDNLTIFIKEGIVDKQYCQLYDALGKLLIKESINSNYTQISLSNLPTAAYNLCIYNKENQKVQSYTIIKK